MSKYILFGGQCYYARGGVNDFIQFGDSIEELKKEFERLQEKNPYYYDWYQIVDRHLNIVSQSEIQPHGN